MRDQHSDAELARRSWISATRPGREIDKFEKFGLTAEKGEKVKAPLIAECFANYECKLVDARLIKKYSLFVLRWWRRALLSRRNFRNDSLSG